MGSLVNLSLASLNCRGLNDVEKRNFLFTKLKDLECSIIFLQETKLHPQNEMNYINEWHNGNVIFNSVDGGKSGTAILFNSEDVVIDNRLTDNHGRIIAVDIDVFGCKFHVINTYFPNHPNEQQAFIKKLSSFFFTRHPIIWGGDHNLVTNAVIDRWPGTRIQDRHHKEITAILNAFDLKDTCREIYPTSLVFTFKTENAKSRIDKIIVPKDFVVKKYVQHEVALTDHMLLEVDIQTNYERVVYRKIWRNDIKVYQSERFLKFFSEYWGVLKGQPELQSNVNKWWMESKQKVKTVLI